MPAVSVIVPAYNVAAYLVTAIESVRAQTSTDFEVIVVNDGSTDDTASIAEAQARQDARIRVRHRQNGGISAARNEGLRAATAPVIAILDGDDVWEPQYLEAQLAIFAERPEIDVVTGNAWFLDGPRDGELARPFPDPRPHPTLATIIADETAVFIMSVFRREVYETIGGFDESFRTNEDYDFWLRAALAGFRFTRNDRPLGHYRRGHDSLSADDLRMVTGLLRVYDKLRGALAERPLERRLLDTQIARFETLLHEIKARHAIATGNFAAATEHLSALQERRGGPRIAVARLMAKWTPGLLARAYEMRRSLRTTST
jgi:glycosyltransferase involved in cell wall biosynthesis